MVTNVVDFFMELAISSESFCEDVQDVQKGNEIHIRCQQSFPGIDSVINMIHKIVEWSKDGTLKFDDLLFTDQ